jgi:glutamine---fructose-6-phosphate transaminase (isomerizing)
MCGIISIISRNLDNKKIFNSLKQLEYRGYDSYGLLLYNHMTNSRLLLKNTGTITNTELKKIKDFKAHIALAHTRWATHGGVTKENAHPHFDNNKQFFVVMNGIIENHEDIKTKLLSNGYQFYSGTDTEIIPALYSHYLNNTKNLKNLDNLTKLKKITTKIIEELEGEFSFIVKYKNYILGYKNINPLIIGTNNNEIFISSDLNQIQHNTTEYIILDDKEIFTTHIKDNLITTKIYNSKFIELEKERKKSKKISFETKKHAQYYMQKEIKDQFQLEKLITPENIKNLTYLKSQLRKKRIIITAAGTSYNAGNYLHYKLLEQNILSNIILASELNNYIPVLEDSLIIALSQSGETADLIHPLKELKKNNEIFGIINTQDSTLDRIATKSIYLNCGPEIAVASTKAFTFQMFFAELLNFTPEELTQTLKLYQHNFKKVIEQNQETLKNIITKFKQSPSFFFIGRNKNFPLAIEGALKLKEISYIHAEGFAGGELKHGSLALIYQDIPIIVIGNDKEIISNATEIKARGGKIIGISPTFNPIFDYHLPVPNNSQEIFSVILMQILAMNMSIKLGHNPDRPRNLAKSVTVK